MTKKFQFEIQAKTIWQESEHALHSNGYRPLVLNIEATSYEEAHGKLERTLQKLIDDVLVWP